MKAPSVILVTTTWDSLGLGTLMRRQGADVLFAYDFTGLKENDLEAAKICGEGMVDRVELDAAMKQYRGAGVLWVFDNNKLWEQAERLTKAGEAVIGTSKLSAQMEDDRDHAAKVAKDVGMSLCQTEEFSDFTKAIAFLEKNKTKGYVFKPYESDAEFTFVPQASDEPAVANEEVREYLASAIERGEKPGRFILQEKLKGTEVNFEIWVNKGKVLAAFVDLEAKRKLVGDMGEMTGCAGDYLFKVNPKSPGIQATAAKYLELPEMKTYVGSIDANVMIVDGKYYFLENCFRYGYNAYPTLFYGLAERPMEDILWAWLAGQDVGAMFGPHYAASLTLFCDHPKPGFPVLLRGAAKEAFCAYSLNEMDGRLGMVGGSWSALGCVVARGSSMPVAGRACLDLADQVAFPDKGHRTDLADGGLDTLPVSRFRELQAAGVFGARPAAVGGSYAKPDYVPLLAHP